MPAILDAPTYLTVQEAADLVRVHPRTIRNRIKEGKLTAKKFGSESRTLLLDQRDVLGMLMDARDTETAEVALAFEGWVEQITEGMATLRLVDQEGQCSVATYAVTDLQRDHIPAEVGANFRCQVIRESTGFHVAFQPVPRRIVSKARRKQLEDEMVLAYSSLKNDY